MVLYIFNKYSWGLFQPWPLELERERIKQVALISGSHGVLSRLDKEQNKWKQQIKTISDLTHSLQQKFVWVIHEDKNKSLDKRKEFENREDVQGK